MRRAIYPGSFNPWHDGHSDILGKALEVFDEIYVAFGTNPDKEKNSKMSVPLADKLGKNIKTIRYQGLLVDVIEELSNNGIKINAVIRGLRDGYDLQYEQKMQYWNEDLGLSIPTVMFICDRQYSHISSSAIRNVNKIKGF